jgi:hypothetical protein
MEFGLVKGIGDKIRELCLRMGRGRWILQASG